MSIDLWSVATGISLLAAASGAAWYLKRRMDSATGLEVIGWAMTLMVANIAQLLGVVVALAGIFG